MTIDDEKGSVIAIYSSSGRERKHDIGMSSVARTDE